MTAVQKGGHASAGSSGRRWRARGCGGCQDRDLFLGRAISTYYFGLAFPQPPVQARPPVRRPEDKAFLIMAAELRAAARTPCLCWPSRSGEHLVDGVPVLQLFHVGEPALHVRIGAHPGGDTLGHASMRHSVSSPSKQALNAVNGLHKESRKRQGRNRNARRPSRAATGRRRWSKLSEWLNPQ
jgi:hypothetical protein